MGVADTVLGLDQFGFVPTLKIQTKEKVPSIFGLLCTILVVVFLLIMFCLGLAALARHNKPTIVATEINGADKKTSIYLNHDSYFFIFGIYDPDDGDGRYYIDPDYFTLDINMIVDEEVKEAYTTANAGVIPLTVKKCQEVMPDYTGFEDNYCFRYDATDNSVFVQKYERAHIEIKLNLCDTSVPGHTCVALTPRDQKIKRSMLYTLIPYYSVDANDYKDPIKMDYAETRTPLTVDTNKEVVVSIQKFTFISDNGWLFESEKKQSGVTMESTVVDFSEDMATGTFLTIIVQGTGDKMEYKRRYPKLQDILSQVVGLASPIFLILGFLIYPYVKVKMQEKLVGDYYDVKTTRGGKPAKGAAFGMANDMKVESMDNGYNPLVKGNQIAPGSPTTPGSVGMSNTTNLRVGFCEWLGSFFKTNIRVKMLQDSQDILTRNVDLFHLNKKIAEIDRIKAVLMTEEQRILFENLPRPVVVMDLEAKPKSKDAIQYENWAEIDEEKTAKVKDAYDAVKSSSSQNACDKKLLSFYEDKY